MSLNQKIIDALTSAYPEPLAYESLVSKLAVSRKRIELTAIELQSQNYPLQFQGNSLVLDYPLLSVPSISKQHENTTIGTSIQLHSTLGSTNGFAKEHLSDLQNGEVVLAHEQTTGKGRMGRNWSSPAGASISMSIVLKPEIRFDTIPLLTQLTAAALVNALKPWADAKIKWPNDIILNKKKIAGILIETEFSGGSLQGIVIGIGINTNLNQQDIPEALKNKATSIKEVTDIEINPNTLIADFLYHFEKYYEDFLNSQRTDPFLSVCRSQSILAGKDYWVIGKGQKRKAYIQTIDPSGGLVVTYHDTNKTEIITSTDLSIRGENDYV